MLYICLLIACIPEMFIFVDFAILRGKYFNSFISQLDFNEFTLPLVIHIIIKFIFYFFIIRIDILDNDYNFKRSKWLLIFFLIFPIFLILLIFLTKSENIYQVLGYISFPLVIFSILFFIISLSLCIFWQCKKLGVSVFRRVILFIPITITLYCLLPLIFIIVYGLVWQWPPLAP